MNRGALTFLAGFVLPVALFGQPPVYVRTGSNPYTFTLNNSTGTGTYSAGWPDNAYAMQLACSGGGPTAPAAAGDTIVIPDGTFVWAYNGGSGNWGAQPVAGVIITSANGPSHTIINVTGHGEPTSYGVILMPSNCTVSNIGFENTGVDQEVCLSTNGTVTGVHVTNCTWTDGSGGYFFMDGGGSSGAIDHCTFNLSATAEFIFTRGPSNAWATASSVYAGTGLGIYLENCTWNSTAQAYTDFNSNGIGVVRFNTITANDKIDYHGLASNTPAQGDRWYEVYCNTWTSTSGNADFMEIRGGDGMIFGNVNAGNNTSGFMTIEDYGYQNDWPNFGQYQTPANYNPGGGIGYQIGAGIYTTEAATAISAWQMVQVVTTGTTDFTTIGGTNTVGAQFIATGPATGSGTVTFTPAAGSPTYLWDNYYGNKNLWLRSFSGNGHSVNSNAQTEYISQVAGGVPNVNAPSTANFSPWDVIQDDRDLFSDETVFNTVSSPHTNPTWTARGGSPSFNGSTGVGGAVSGTTAQMNAITPSKTGVGFWCTDQGTWNNGFSGTQTGSAILTNEWVKISSLGTTNWATVGDPNPSPAVGDTFLTISAGSGTGSVTPGQGELYEWNGSSWVLEYEPYPYPYQFAATSVPVITPATVNATVGVALSYQVQATQFPTGFTAVSGLPSWATFSSGGLITGTPPNTTGQPFSFVCYATNGLGNSANGTITIDVGNVPAITSSSTVGVTRGSGISYTITGSNSPTSYGATSLPSWASVNPATGALTGTPTTVTGSPFSATVSATNIYGTGYLDLTITVNPQTLTSVTITGPFFVTGNPLTPTYTTSPSGGTVSFSPATETNAGTYSIGWTGTGSYTGSGTTSWTINPTASHLTANGATTLP